MITIKPSPTADSRCCDAKNISLETVRMSTLHHRHDVAKVMQFFAAMLGAAGQTHDDHKLKTMEAFHKAFIGGFVDETWWNEHKKERHHLPADLADVNLVDIFEFIADCVTTGMAQTGKVRPLTISDEMLQMLQKAFQNTVNLLINNIELEQ